MVLPFLRTCFFLSIGAEFPSDCCFLDGGVAVVALLIMPGIIEKKTQIHKDKTLVCMYLNIQIYTHPQSPCVQSFACAISYTNHTSPSLLIPTFSPALYQRLLQLRACFRHRHSTWDVSLMQKLARERKRYPRAYVCTASTNRTAATPWSRS